MNTLGGRILSGLKTGLSSAFSMLIVMVPISLVVLILKMTGILAVVAGFFSPLMALAGLPGNTALVFITAGLTNIYSAIAVLLPLGLDPRGITIIAIMCLISHNLPVELGVMKKTGSSVAFMLILRVGTAFLMGIVLNQLIPHPAGDTISVILTPAAGNTGFTLAFWLTPGFLQNISSWALDSLSLSVKIIILISLLMTLQVLLKEYRILDALTRFFSPLIRLLGLPPRVSFHWLILQSLGLAYGAGVMIAEVKNGQLTPEDGDKLNTHAAICHSLLEDTLLFAGIGAFAVWITIPRLCAAALAVWMRRGVEYLLLRLSRLRKQEAD